MFLMGGGHHDPRLNGHSPLRGFKETRSMPVSTPKPERPVYVADCGAWPVPRPHCPGSVLWSPRQDLVPDLSVRKVSATPPSPFTYSGGCVCHVGGGGPDFLCKVILCKFGRVLCKGGGHRGTRGGGGGIGPQSSNPTAQLSNTNRTPPSRTPAKTTPEVIHNGGAKQSVTDISE